MVVWFQSSEEAAIYAGFMRSQGHFAQMENVSGTNLFGPMGFGGIRVFVSESPLSEKADPPDLSAKGSICWKILNVFGWFLLALMGLSLSILSLSFYAHLFALVDSFVENLWFYWFNPTEFALHLKAALPEIAFLGSLGLFFIAGVIALIGIHAVVLWLLNKQFRRIGQGACRWNHKLWLYPLVLILVCHLLLMY